jgi:DNA repair protein RadC
MLDAFAVSGTSPTYRYRVRELRYSVVRERDLRPPRDLSSPISALCLVNGLGDRLLPDDGKEHFAILMLDTKNRFLAFHAVSTGTLSATPVHPRDVFGPALRTMGVAGIILVHRQLVDCARILDMRILDHLVIGHGSQRSVSFVERGLL